MWTVLHPIYGAARTVRAQTQRGRLGSDTQRVGTGRDGPDTLTAPLSPATSALSVARARRSATAAGPRRSCERFRLTALTAALRTQGMLPSERREHLQDGAWAFTASDPERATAFEMAGLKIMKKAKGVCEQEPGTRED